jgi:hypothetical protein
MTEAPRALAAAAGGLPLSGESLAGLMGAVLEKGKPFRFEARGESMRPAIRDGDIVTVAPKGGRTPRTGDIVAFVHPETAAARIHRIVGVEEGRYILKGDNALGADPAVGRDAILGFVVILERGGRRRPLEPSFLAAALARLSRSAWFTRLARRIRRTFSRQKGRP